MKKYFCCIVAVLLMPAIAMSLELYKKDDMSFGAGWWGQAWVQMTTDMDTDNDGAYNDTSNDFLFRRSYFYLQGTVNPNLDFFIHFAGDKLGMDEITENSGTGLGSGTALRDAWMNYRIAGDDLMVQVGRMYIPFTRNYGTTSTKSLLIADLGWGQGGLRSSIFYPSTIGRDDAVTLWGNILEDRLQYRFMIGDGEDSDAKNPSDNPRFAGRLSYSLLDPETQWFNAGTYLGAKRVLAVGIGFDVEQDMVISVTEKDYSAWTLDVHYDQPLSCGNSLTLEISYIDISHSANAISWTDFSAGDDGALLFAQAGYYFGQKIGPGNLQPYAHMQQITSATDGDDDTTIYGLGLNYYLKGAANKVTLDATCIKQEDPVAGTPIQDNTMITLQFAAGF